ncbi:hypothetical protein EU805_09910 [Salipiger sp. IMCC34102]|uniref:hypothetical protein n=1 Tax=Salipiger sp. IMCC34102 TaxID=2510647 RepID=UPI00101C650D|nr:hypothetical protein [Salipiger sp. IMCC34102]RYH02166.1 hypothetical protein EU805_09910 [Salipiger sp. IMCC34102]
MKSISLAILLILAATMLRAGAWPREEGDLFIAAGGNFLLSEGARLPVHYDPTLYAEYGFSPRLTLGTDLHTADAGRIFSTFVFAMTPFGDPEADLRRMAGFGLGYRQNNDGTEEALIRPALSLGQSTGSGWLAFDGTVTYGTEVRTWRPKADFTWGHNWTDRITTTFQIQTGTGFTGDHYAKISPTVIWTVNDRVKLNLGAVQALTGDRGSALKFETWLNF